MDDGKKGNRRPEILPPDKAAKLVHGILTGKVSKLTRAKRKALTNTLLALGDVRHPSTGNPITDKDFASATPSMYHIAIKLPAKYNAKLCVAISGALDITLVRYGKEPSARSFVGASSYVYLIEPDFTTAIPYVLVEKTKEVTQFANKLAALILLYGGGKREKKPKTLGIKYNAAPRKNDVKIITIAVSNRYVKEPEHE